MRRASAARRCFEPLVCLKSFRCACLKHTRSRSQETDIIGIVIWCCLWDSVENCWKFFGAWHCLTGWEYLLPGQCRSSGPCGKRLCRSQAMADSAGSLGGVAKGGIAIPKRNSLTRNLWKIWNSGLKSVAAYKCNLPNVPLDMNKYRKDFVSHFYLEVLFMFYSCLLKVSSLSLSGHPPTATQPAALRSSIEVLWRRWSLGWCVAAFTGELLRRASMFTAFVGGLRPSCFEEIQNVYFLKTAWWEVSNNSNSGGVI